MPTSGQTRTKFCEICERETIQRLDHMQKAGSGKVIAEVWTCVETTCTASLRVAYLPS